MFAAIFIDGNCVFFRLWKFRFSVLLRCVCAETCSPRCSRCRFDTNQPAQHTAPALAAVVAVAAALLTDDYVHSEWKRLQSSVKEAPNKKKINIYVFMIKILYSIRFLLVPCLNTIFNRFKCPIVCSYAKRVYSVLRPREREKEVYNNNNKYFGGEYCVIIRSYFIIFR